MNRRCEYLIPVGCSGTGENSVECRASADGLDENGVPICNSCSVMFAVPYWDFDGKPVAA